MFPIGHLTGACRTARLPPFAGQAFWLVLVVSLPNKLRDGEEEFETMKAWLESVVLGEPLAA